MSEAILEDVAVETETEETDAAKNVESEAPVSEPEPSTPKAVRKFIYNGMSLDDPAPEDSSDKVRNFYANMYPELINAAIKGPTKNAKDEQVYTFVISLGNKG